MVKRLQEIDIIDASNETKKLKKSKKNDKVETPVVEKSVKVKKPPTEKQLAAVARMREVREFKKQEKLKAEQDAVNDQKKLERKLKREEKAAKQKAEELQMIVDSVKEEHKIEDVVEEQKVDILKPEVSTPIKTNPPEIQPVKLTHRIWKAPKYEKDFARGYKKMGQSLFGRPFHAGKRLH